MNTSLVKVRNLTVVSTMFQLLWVGQVISWLGDDLHRVGMAWFVNEHFGNIYSQVGLGVAMALPMALAAVFAGVIVDRFSKSRLLLLTDLARAAISGGAALLFWIFEPNLWVIYAITALIGLAGLMFNPAVQTLLPEIAQGDRDLLVRMNTWHMSSITVLRVAAPAMAGVLLPYVSIVGILWFDAFSFLFSAFMVNRMMKEMRKAGIETEQKLPKEKSMWSDAWDGIRFILTHRVLGPQFTVFPLLEGVMVSVTYLLPVLLSSQMQDAKIYGIMIGLFALGRVLGLAGAKRTGLINRRGVVFSLNLLLQGGFLAVIGSTDTVWVMMAAFLLMGIPSGAASICVNTYVQDSIEPQYRGRIFAAITSLATVLIPACIIGSGILAAKYGVGQVFVMSSILLIAAGLFIASRPEVRNVH